MDLKPIISKKLPVQVPIYRHIHHLLVNVVWKVDNKVNSIHIYTLDVCVIFISILHT